MLRPQIADQASWSVQVGSGTSEHTKLLLDAGAAHGLVRILDSPSAEVREQAAWALGNIAGDPASGRGAPAAQLCHTPLCVLAATPRACSHPPLPCRCGD